MDREIQWEEENLHGKYTNTYTNNMQLTSNRKSLDIHQNVLIEQQSGYDTFLHFCVKIVIWDLCHV